MEEMKQIVLRNLNEMLSHAIAIKDDAAADQIRVIIKNVETNL